MSNNKKEIREDGIYVWCYAEEIFKPESEFEIYSSNKNVYFRNCKECGDANTRRLRNERELSFELLKSLGYDVEGEIPIHVQFNKKHNL